MKREKLVTADGSHTVRIEEMNVTYHSTHGAVQESMHVFIDAGLREAATEERNIHIFEMGFGTGLNALLTIAYAADNNLRINYEAVEAFPLVEMEPAEFNYTDQMNRKDLTPIFEALHRSEWNTPNTITANFQLTKHQCKLENLPAPQQPFDLVYYDAFAPGAQPELWTETVFRQLADMMNTDGVLVTYCSKGDVRRAMIAAGFIVEKIPGPPGKREMLRAFKK